MPIIYLMPVPPIQVRNKVVALDGRYKGQIVTVRDMMHDSALPSPSPCLAAPRPPNTFLASLGTWSWLYFLLSFSAHCSLLPSVRWGACLARNHAFPDHMTHPHAPNPHVNHRSSSISHCLALPPFLPVSVTFVNSRSSPFLIRDAFESRGSLAVLQYLIALRRHLSLGSHRSHLKTLIDRLGFGNPTAGLEGLFCL